MSLARFIAQRIWRSDQSAQRVSRPAIRICTAGVAVGLAVMIVSVAVVIGFKHTIRDKVVGFGSHIQVGDFLTLQTGEPFPVQMNDSMMQVLRATDGIRHVQRFAMRQGILKTDHDFMGVLFKGVAQEFDTAFIHQHLTEGHIPQFSDSLSSAQMLVSQYMAQRLKLHTGDRLFAYFIDQDGVRTRRFTISGIYNTHLAQYDQTLCYTDLYTIQRLNRWNPDQASGAELTTQQFAQLETTAAALTAKVNRTADAYGETYSTRTIKELNPQIFYWLDLLDLNVWVILGLMIVVAAVTMVSGLLIIILERTAMIGLLKALGAPNRTIRHTFLWLSGMIIGRGLIIGNLIALAILLLQQHTGIVHLDPDIYYVNILPVEINLFTVLALNLATLVICLLILVLPSHFIARISPTRTMRYA